MKFGPTGIIIGGVEIFAYYGIIITFGALCAAALAAREARRRGQNMDLVWDGLIWLLIGGIIGARLWHVFTPPPSLVAEGQDTWFYLTHPLDLVMTRKGGLGIPGGVIGGGLALFLFTRRHKLNFGIWADIAAPALALGQAIGRWGNYINQELYGAPTNLPWRIFISPANRLPGYENVAYYHPLFLYESLWNFANFLLLMWLSRKHSAKLLPGDIFLVYLVVYPFGRFMLEFLRLDPSMVGGININQTIMLVVGVLAAATLTWRHVRRRPSGEASAA
jgi:phosphatidylglycerol:prolipoprotein diacylglycerol transferase